MRFVVLVCLTVIAGLPFAPALARQTVVLPGYAPGMIVIKTAERKLYWVEAPGRAVEYPVGVGRDGMRWSGTSYVNAKDLHPAWAPPAGLSRRHFVIAGGSPRNPMGAAALGIAHTGYGIHGTNNPASVGKFVSHGCIRMYNADILDLYRRVQIGTKITVLP